mmetsp:Transcript_20602/g.32221  ORF Transcript_20602/g.32221 Transcript_20602/m.32221 type:complete len:96 (-) Transcript_20602:152-439(-)
MSELWLTITYDGNGLLLTVVSSLQFLVAPGQQLYYYGARTWPDGVRKGMYNQFGGMPKDLMPAHDYDPKVLDSGESSQYWMPGSLDSQYYAATGF